MSRFQSGQVWQYKTRPGDEASRIVILQVDPHLQFGAIVHIQVTDVMITNSMFPNGAAKTMSHLPCSEQALENSVTVLENEGAVPSGWEEGYSRWKSAFEADQTGVFTIAVADTVDSIAQVLAKG